MAKVSLWIRVTLGALAVGVWFYWLYRSVFYHDYRNLMTLEEPAYIEQFSVADGNGRVLWQIRADPPVRVSVISYGVVPKGFVQSQPSAAGELRPFVSSERLVIEILTTKALIRHEGVAVGQDGFKGGFSRSSPIKKQDRGEARNHLYLAGVEHIPCSEVLEVAFQNQAAWGPLSRRRFSLTQASPAAATPILCSTAPETP